MNKKYMPAYLRALVQVYKAAKRAGIEQDAQYHQNMFNNNMYEYAQVCSIDEYEVMWPVAKEIDSDFFDA